MDQRQPMSLLYFCLPVCCVCLRTCCIRSYSCSELKRSSAGILFTTKASCVGVKVAMVDVIREAPTAHTSKWKKIPPKPKRKPKKKKANKVKRERGSENMGERRTRKKKKREERKKRRKGLSLGLSGKECRLTDSFVLF